MGATAKPSRSSGGAVRRVEAGSVRASTRRCISSKRRRIAWPWYWVRKPEGLDVSAAERVFGIRHATITRWLMRAGAHAQTLHERSFPNFCVLICTWMNCARGCVATPRCSGFGSPLIRSRSAFRCCFWVRGPTALPTCLSTTCESSWPPFCYRSSPAMASMCTSTPHHHFRYWVKEGWEQEETVAGGDRLALWPASRNAISGAG